MSVISRRDFLKAGIALPIAISSAYILGEPVPTVVEASGPLYKGAFYYPWYPSHWSASHVWTPNLGLYNSASASVIDTHVTQMKSCHFDVGISSWWGQSDDSAAKFPLLLNNTQGFKWCTYYEDNAGTKNLFQIWSDINYMKSRYFSHPNYFKIGGKPVVFVFSPLATSSYVDTWSMIRSLTGVYTNMSTLSGYQNKLTSASSWHKYQPRERITAAYRPSDSHVYAYAISAGWWQGNEQALVRNPAEYSQLVTAAKGVPVDWLLGYWNEFLEGTNMEPSNADATFEECLVPWR